MSTGLPRRFAPRNDSFIEGGSAGGRCELAMTLGLLIRFNRGMMPSAPPLYTTSAAALYDQRGEQ